MSDVGDQEDAKSTKYQSTTSQDYAGRNDDVRQENSSSRKNARQSRMSPRHTPQEEYTSPLGSAQQSNMSPGRNAEQEATIIMSQAKTGTGDNANKTNADPGNAPMSSSAAENTAAMTAASEPPIEKEPFFQPPATYRSPYTTVYDPAGHYARAYRRILGPSQTEQPQGTSDNGRYLPQNADHQRLESTRHPRGRTPFTTNIPTNSRVPDYVPSGSPSEDFRFGAFEPHQDRTRNHYRRSPSPDFPRVERITHDEVQTPLGGPVVIGRVVQRGRKRSRVRTYSEYEEGDRSNGPSSPFHQAEFARSNASYARIDDRRQDVDARHRIPDTSRARTPKDNATNKRLRREEHYLEDDHYNRKGNYMSGDDYDSDSGLFVSQSRPGRLSRSTRPDHHEYHRELSTRRTAERQYSDSPAPRPRPEPKGYFSVFGQNLEPSRYSGVAMPWDISVDPEMVEQSQVSDASLLKRNIARGKGKKICKRSYGASDPENIAIVNMKEFDNLSFDEIARRLNDQRVQEGKEPSLSAVGVNSRYNRTAPLLFSSQGKEFIPLSKRRGKAREVYEASRDGIMEWNEQLDLTLVNAVKEVDAARWNTVATLFEKMTGKTLTAAAAAVRHSML